MLRINAAFNGPLESDDEDDEEEIGCPECGSGSLGMLQMQASGHLAVGIQHATIYCEDCGHALSSSTAAIVNGPGEDWDEGNGLVLAA